VHLAESFGSFIWDFFSRGHFFYISFIVGLVLLVGFSPRFVWRYKLIRGTPVRGTIAGIRSERLSALSPNYLVDFDLDGKAWRWRTLQCGWRKKKRLAVGTPVTVMTGPGTLLYAYIDDARYGELHYLSYTVIPMATGAVLFVAGIVGVFLSV